MQTTVVKKKPQINIKGQGFQPNDIYPIYRPCFELWDPGDNWLR